MFWRCIGPQKQVKSRTRQISTAANHISDETKPVDYSPAFKLENNHIRLQNDQRLAYQEMIKILSNSLKKTKAWKKKWYKSSVDNRDDAATSSETMRELFAASISAVDVTIEEMNQSIKDLKKTRDLIPKPKKDQSLEFKMNQARSNVDELTKKIHELEGEERKLKRKLNRLKINSPSNLMESTDCQTPLDVETERHDEIEALIVQKKKLLRREERSFYNQQAELFAESKNYELERCLLLKQQSKDFVESLNIKDDEFDEVLENCNPEKELIQWEKKTFRRQTKRSGKSQPTENETSD